MHHDRPAESSDFQEKFVGFIDILGFKNMVEAAERGEGRSIEEIHGIVADLASYRNRAFFEKHGPTVCPQSPRIDRHLSFEVTQISDCAVVSAEISPAGVINLIQHCWGAAITLLTKGVMVRGYITRGKIIHEGNRLMGTGYHTAYQRESGVSAFKKEVDEKGTPFVEIDPSVVDYVEKQEDACVKTMFGRMAKTDGSVTALFPFQVLSHSFLIGGFGVQFDAEKEKQNNDNVRKNLHTMIQRVKASVEEGNESAMRKARHYLSALEEQLQTCDKTDELIDKLVEPIGRKR